ncbi:MAG: hypothetical protein HGA44_19645 [Cellulomonadaceae bacterium]|nr:hypothetical protein [Cellulomonadaceae bacterium]
MKLEVQPCNACQSLAYIGRHEPYLIDDIPMRLRFWRCSSCGALWCEREHSVVVVAESEADTLIPGWRDRVDRLRECSLADLLGGHADGEVDNNTVGVELLRRAVWVAEAVASASATEMPEELILFSAPQHAMAHGVGAVVAVPGADILGRALVARIVIDPSGPSTVVLDGMVAWTLFHEAARTTSVAPTDSVPSVGAPDLPASKEQSS